MKNLIIIVFVSINVALVLIDVSPLQFTVSLTVSLTAAMVAGWIWVSAASERRILGKANDLEVLLEEHNLVACHARGED